MICYPVSAAGIQTRVLDAGHGSKTAVFVHGVGARADRWIKCLESLPDGVRGVAIDLPGHGFATKGVGPAYSVPAFADFLHEILETLGITRPVGVGTSLGAHVVATLEVERPGTFSRLVLVGATGIVPLGQETRTKIADHLTDRSRAGVVEKLRWVVVDPNLVTDDWVEEEFRVNNSYGAAESFEALAAYFESSIDDDVVGHRLRLMVEANQTAVSLVWGAQDRSVPIEIGKAASKVLGDLPLLTIEDAAHAPYFEQPERFLDVLSQLI